MAVFGFPLTDVATLCTLTWNLYRGCKNAGREFEVLQNEVNALHTALRLVQDETENPDSILSRGGDAKKVELEQLIQVCSKSLESLDLLLKKYESLSTQSRVTWDRIKFGAENLQQIRGELVVHASTLTLFLESLNASSLYRIEKKLDKLIKDVREGRREPSVLTIAEDDSQEADEQWNSFRQELLDDGFDKIEIEAKKNWIKAKLQQLIDDGDLEEHPLSMASESGFFGSQVPAEVSPGHSGDASSSATFVRKSPESERDKFKSPVIQEQTFLEPTRITHQAATEGPSGDSNVKHRMTGSPPDAMISTSHKPNLSGDKGGAPSALPEKGKPLRQDETSFEVSEVHSAFSSGKGESVFERRVPVDEQSRLNTSPNQDRNSAHETPSNCDDSNTYDLSGMPPKPDWNNAHKPPEVYWQFIQRHRRRFWWSLLVIFLLMVLVTPLAVVYGRKGKALTLTSPQLSAALPVSDTYLAAAAVVLGTIFHPPLDGPALKVAYNAEGGKICVLSKMGSTWMNKVQCVDGAHLKEGTPLTMLDWVGGPSIYFITTDNYLSGIDYMVTNGTWKLSDLVEQKLQTHGLSQLASCSWTNGTSAWIYFQDPNEELREFGKDDYRDTKWREGGTRLGKMIAGTGIAAIAWRNDTDEIEEIFFHAANGTIKAKMYKQQSWQQDVYTIYGSQTKAVPGTCISATTVDGNNGITVFLAYAADNGFITAQTRGTANITDYGAFSTAINLTSGDGQQTKFAIATEGLLGLPNLYFKLATGLFELSSNNLTASDWTSKGIP